MPQTSAKPQKTRAELKHGYTPFIRDASGVALLYFQNSTFILDSSGRRPVVGESHFEDRVDYNVEVRERVSEEGGEKNALRDNGRRRHMTSPIYHLCLVDSCTRQTKEIK